MSLDKDPGNMGMPDVEEFLEFYLLDSQEQIERLGASILDLERDSENIGLINELFRSAHSLKGASGTMGFTAIVEVTHAAEDLLDKVRQGKLTVTHEIIDVLLEVTDVVKDMLAQVEAQKPVRHDAEDLVKRICRLAKGVITETTDIQTMSEDPDPEPAPRVEFALDENAIMDLREVTLFGQAIYQLTVILDEQALMKTVRAVMVIQRLQDLGKVLAISPSIENMELMEEEEISNDRFYLLLATDEREEEILSEIYMVSDVIDIHVSIFDSSEISQLIGIEPLEQPLAEKLSTEMDSSKETARGVSHEASTETEAYSKFLRDNVQPPSGGDGGGGKSDQVHTIRVDTDRMDSLINMVGEMVITRARLVKIGDDLRGKFPMDALVNNLNETNIYLGRLMNDLQESAMRLRMVPVGTVFSRYPRLVRDFCRKTGKKIDLELHGEETEMDKTVIEQIGDPLTHLIRNCVDHGIEDPGTRLAAGKSEIGKIILKAYHEGNHIAIVISDDGDGLDLQKIMQKALTAGLIGENEDLSEREIANLIFLPGFSTADQITDISGRGVGMDVVKRALSGLGGTVDIRTKAGEGTVFTIKLPLTLAIIQALLVGVCGEIYAVPLSSVQETLRVQNEDVRTVGGIKMAKLRGNTLPLLSLKSQFGLPEDDEKETVFVVVVGVMDRLIGLMVDELKGQQEIVLKTLGDDLGSLPGISGATILGDGKVTLILDVGTLMQDVLTY
ncbi:MAG: chemotaxis protein CheA [Peptococcaceae bacterium]|nr:chemotaxis protein CheA [Peptococcaceae bacterium]